MLAADIGREGVGPDGWVASEFKVWRPLGDAARILMADGEEGMALLLAPARNTIPTMR